MTLLQTIIFPKSCIQPATSTFKPRSFSTIKAALSVDAPPQKATQRVKLGESDLLVSECCLGTMTWGEQNTEEEAHQQLSYSFDLGINFLDTAEMYPVMPRQETQGRTEQYIGNWMQNRKRDDIIIATKVSGYSNKSYMGRGDFTRVSPEQIKAGVDKSLERLKTDYIDLLQIHWPDRYVPIFGARCYDITQEREFVPFEEQLQGMQDVIKAGKVRYIGVSNETSYGVSQFSNIADKLGLPKIQTIQNAYSLLVRVEYETNLAETCRFNNVSLLAYSPLAGGVLSGKYLNGTATENSRYNKFKGYQARYYESYTRDATIEYQKIAKKYGISLAQMSLAFCQSRWFVTSSIIGATTMEQLKENVEAFNVELPEECFNEIAEVYQQYRDPTIFR
eukprot:TRINITY_DN3964_c0_g1_i14.p1 TRINITY_DN3964_c0_g1~~TRINITY_DN3964_c0_g1_i14.p1  ORF type:complete len:404 (+),score=41.23 TRINITY_DN3964_c0_g1_i14:39-1214(+)